MYKVNVFCVLWLSFLFGCSLAPVVSEKTARTLGDGNWETNVGLSPAPSITIGRGFGESVDLHLSIESQIVPLIDIGGKFSITQRKEGVSFSIFAGGFSDTSSSSGFYAGPIISLKSKWFEVYALGKYNNVTWKASEKEQAKDSVFDFSLNSDQNFDYWLAVVGINLWFNDGVGLNLNAKKFLIKNTSDDGDNILPSLHLLMRY